MGSSILIKRFNKELKASASMQRCLRERNSSFIAFDLPTLGVECRVAVHPLKRPKVSLFIQTHILTKTYIWYDT